VRYPPEPAFPVLIVEPPGGLAEFNARQFTVLKLLVVAPPD
jgi:hypothetical protein